MRHITISLIILVTVLLFFVSCKKETTKTGNTITIQLNAEPSSLSPFWGGDANRNLLLNYTTQGLVMMNPEDGSPVPVLAASLPRVGADGKTYSFGLASDAAWSDGKALTEEDVIFSMKAALATESPRAAMRDLFVAVEAIRKISEKGIEVVFQEKNVTNESFFYGIPIVDKRVYDPENLLAEVAIEELIDFAKNDSQLSESGLAGVQAWNAFLEQENFGQSPASTAGTLGPYELNQWVQGSHILLTARAGFWAKNRTSPWFSQQADSLLFRFVSDPTSLRLQIRQQAFDLALQIPGTAFDDSMKTPDYNYQSYKGSVFTYLAFNTRTTEERGALLSKQTLRTAVSQLIPVSEIIEDHYQGRGVQVLSPVAPEKSSYNQNIKPERFDPVAAGQLLDDANMLDTDKDLIRDFEENGARKNVSFTMLYPAGVAPAEATALRLQDEGRKIGIEITIEPLAFRDLFGRVMSHKYEAALLASSISPFPYDFGQDFQSGYQGNHTGFSSPELDSLIQLANRSLNSEKRDEIMWQIQAIIHREKPVVYLFTTTQPVAIHKRLGNVKVMPFSPYVWSNTL